MSGERTEELRFWRFSPSKDAEAWLSDFTVLGTTEDRSLAADAAHFGFLIGEEVTEKEAGNYLRIALGPPGLARLSYAIKHDPQCSDFEAQSKATVDKTRAGELMSEATTRAMALLIEARKAGA